MNPTKHELGNVAKRVLSDFRYIHDLREAANTHWPSMDFTRVRKTALDLRFDTEYRDMAEFFSEPTFRDLFKHADITNFESDASPDECVNAFLQLLEAAARTALAHVVVSDDAEGVVARIGFGDYSRVMGFIGPNGFERGERDCGLRMPAAAGGAISCERVVDGGGVTPLKGATILWAPESSEVRVTLPEQLEERDQVLLRVGNVILSPESAAGRTRTFRVPESLKGVSTDGGMVIELLDADVSDAVLRSAERPA